MNALNSYMKSKRTAMIFTAAVIVVVVALYIILGSSQKSMVNAKPLTTEKLDLFKDMEIKAVYNDDGTMDMFATAPVKDMSAYSAVKGNPAPDTGGIVLGSEQGVMMRKEGEWRRIGDKIEEQGALFKVSGVLEPTGTFADDAHFLSSEDYSKLEGGAEGVLVIRLKDNKVPKLFYLYDKNEKTGLNLTLAEGSMVFYVKQTQGKKIYYPVILGSAEANMMREEKLFRNVGDIVDDFFGKDVIIIGVLQQTDTGLDMAHIVEKDYFNTKVIQ